MSEDLPLLLLHPIAQDTACWRLAGFDTTHAYTYPGHGGLPRRALSLAELADDAAGSVEGRFDLLGVAMGSIVGQHVLLRHGDRVRSAVLACGAPATRREALEGRAAAALRDGMEGVTPSTLERWFTAPALATPGHPGVEYARRVLLAMEPEALAEAWLALAGHDVRAQLGSIATPVTVVSGNEDAATAAGALEAMAAALPGARFEAMAGPHMIHLEEPAAFATALERHLESVKEMGL